MCELCNRARKHREEWQEFCLTFHKNEQPSVPWPVMQKNCEHRIDYEFKNECKKRETEFGYNYCTTVDKCPAAKGELNQRIYEKYRV